MITVELGAGLALGVMALTTYGTRILGAVIMSRVPLLPVVRRFLRALSGSVLVALVVPPTLNGDLALQGAVATSIAVMLGLKNASLAILAGIIAAVIIRQFGG
jgi:uncharacterized membrane protein